MLGYGGSGIEFLPFIVPMVVVTLLSLRLKSRSAAIGLGFLISLGLWVGAARVMPADIANTSDEGLIRLTVLTWTALATVLAALPAWILRRQEARTGRDA